MNRLTPYYLAALAGLTLACASASAKVMAPSPLSDRVARSDAVLVGKVTRIEDKIVKTADGRELQVAVVEVKDGLAGTDKQTHVRVGFVPGMNRRFPHLNLQEGQESLFFVAKQPGENFYTFQMYFDVLDKKGETFEKDVEATRKLAKAMAGAESGLESKDAGERFLSAALLVLKYRSPRPTHTRQVEVEAATSKAILEALAGADWGAKGTEDAMLTPPMVFRRLGVGPQDGFKPAPGGAFDAAAKDWLKANAGTYKIKQFAPEK